MTDKNRLYGFKRRAKFKGIPNDMDESVCAELFADECVIHIINRIAEKHRDLFIWNDFSAGAEDTHMLLLYRDTRAVGTGIEIMFSFWKHGEQKVTLVGAYKEDTSEAKDYSTDWLLDKTPADKISNEILALVAAYQENGVVGMYAVEVTRYED